MNYLSIENLSKSFDEKLLFEEITFGLEQGQKAALVGVNGCGKSTLLKIIGGLETQNKGEVSFRKGLTIAILPQNPQFEDDETIMQAVFSENREELNLIRDYEHAILKSETDPMNAPDISPLIEQIDALNAWDYEHQVKQILGKLGIHDLDKKMGTLSGGQKKRVAIAQSLVVKPDFLILDEPTNHLDLEIIEWLENYLATQNLTLLMVTHDRYFLDKVTNEIIEMDQGKLFRYKGNYSSFLEKKDERQAQEAASVDKAKNTMRTELEWMRRQPKARGTKAKYRIDAFYDLKDKASQNTKQQEVKINLEGERQGKKILEMHHICKSYDSIKIIDNFSYVFRRKERVGIVGVNGVGKSTFLNLLIGEIKADSGKRDTGLTTKFGYYTQEEEVFDPNKKVIDIIKDVAEFIKLADGHEVSASNLLNQFLFPPKMQYNLVGKLSGGEKRRLQLLRVLMSNPNFLILDEPTNDLDILTLNVLEDYLKEFAGCLIIVSHDRYFMDRLVDHLFIFKGNGAIKDYPGNYSDYRNSEKFGLSEEPVTIVKAKQTKSEAKALKKLSYNEQREIDQIDKELPDLTVKKLAIEEQLTKETDYEQLILLGKELDQLKEEIEEKEMRWLKLNE